MNRFELIATATALSLALILSQHFLRKSANYQLLEYQWFIYVAVSLMIYVIIFLYYSFLLKKFDVTKIYPLYTAFSIFGVCLVGVFFHGEVLSRINIVGLLFLILGVIMLLD